MSNQAMNLTRATEFDVLRKSVKARDGYRQGVEILSHEK
jgi:hypothetical protein